MTGTPFSSTYVAAATPRVTEDPEFREQDGNDFIESDFGVEAVDVSTDEMAAGHSFCCSIAVSLFAYYFRASRLRRRCSYDDLGGTRISGRMSILKSLDSHDHSSYALFQLPFQGAERCRVTSCWGAGRCRHDAAFSISSIVVQHPHRRHQSASWHLSKNDCPLLSTWIGTCTSSDTPVHTK